MFPPCLKEREEEHVPGIAEGKRGFIDHFTLIVKEENVTTHIQTGKTKKSSRFFFYFSLVHHWDVGFDIAAFNPAGQMKGVQDTDFLYIHNSPTTAEPACVSWKMFLHKSTHAK